VVITKAQKEKVDRWVDAVESKDIPAHITDETIDVVGASPVLVENIKKEPTLSKKTAMYIGVATALIAAIGVLLVPYMVTTSMGAAPATTLAVGQSTLARVPAMLGKRLAVSALKLLSEGIHITAPVAMAITPRLVNEVKKLFNFMNVSDDMVKELDGLTKGRPESGLLQQKQESLKEWDGQIKSLEGCLNDIQTSIQNVPTYTTDDIRNLKVSVGKCNELLTQSLNKRVQTLKEIEDIRHATQPRSPKPPPPPPPPRSPKPPPPRSPKPPPPRSPKPPPPPPRSPKPPPQLFESIRGETGVPQKFSPNLLASITGRGDVKLRPTQKPDAQARERLQANLLGEIVGTRLKKTGPREEKRPTPTPGFNTDMLKKLEAIRNATRADDPSEDSADWDPDLSGGGRLYQKWLTRKFNTY
jgi:hypothetical protein